MLGIPLRNDLPAFELQAALDGATYTLRFQWNERASAWFMDVLDEQAETHFLASLKLVLGAMMGANIVDRSPQGVFMLLDTSHTFVDPGLNDLGQRIRLEYVTVADLKQLLG